MIHFPPYFFLEIPTHVIPMQNLLRFRFTVSLDKKICQSNFVFIFFYWLHFFRHVCPVQSRLCCELWSPWSTRDAPGPNHGLQSTRRTKPIWSAHAGQGPASKITKELKLSSLYNFFKKSIG